MATIEQIDDLILHGSLPAARRIIRDAAKRAIPDRAFRSELANAARRAGIPDLALRLLAPLVRPAPRSSSRATDEERAFYAAALSEVGAPLEAIELLRTIDGRSFPWARLYEAFACSSLWDHASAAGLLERFLEHPAITPYDRIFAGPHLANALILGGGDRRRARSILDDAVSATSPSRYRIVHRTALFGLVLHSYLDGDVPGARRILDRLGRDCVEPGYERIEILIAAWRAVLGFRSAGAAARAEAFRDLRKFSARLGGFRAHPRMRLYYFLYAEASKDARLLLDLYFGSPFPAFRTRVVEALRSLGVGAAEIPPRHEWRLGEGNGPAVTVDVSNGVNSAGGGYLKEGQTLQRLLGSLSSDFFRPLRLGELHAAVFPGEYFNPQSGPDRVHQAIYRLRSWFQAQGIPLDIREIDRWYQLAAGKPCVIVVQDPGGQGAAGAKVRIRRAIGVAAEKGGGRAFSSRELAQWLGVSIRTANDLIAEAEKSGVVTRAGKGPRTRYAIAGSGPSPRRSAARRNASP